MYPKLSDGRNDGNILSPMTAIAAMDPQLPDSIINDILSIESW